MKPTKEDIRFGQDRTVKVVFDTNLFTKLEKYLAVIKESPEKMGQKLSRYIARIGVNVQDLTSGSLHQYILRTKEPVVFAERHVKGDGSDWNIHELDILGDTSFITEVITYDNGASGSDDSALKVEQYKEPLETQYLISVSGPIFKAGTSDYNDVVDQNGDIDYAKYYQKIEKLLLPSLLAQNEICRNKDLDGIITLPGIGCGEFAGEFRGIMGVFLNAAIKDLLAKHNKSLDNIKGIVLDTFAECRGEFMDFGHIKYVVAPSGLADKTNSDHHLEVDGKKLYLSQLAGPAERAEFFKALGLDIEEDRILCASFVAADKCSHLGNDAIAGYRTTDEGRKAAATDLMAVHSASEGYYDISNEKSPRYRSYTPGDQGYGYAFIDNRDNLLPITHDTVYAAKCDYEANTLSYDPKISSAFYVKLCQFHKGKDTKHHKLVEQVVNSGTKYEKILSELLSEKARELQKYKLEDGVLRGQEAGDEMYNGLVDLFIDQNPQVVRDVAQRLSSDNSTIYSCTINMIKQLNYGYPTAYKGLFKSPHQSQDVKLEFRYDIAKALTHDILANYTVAFQAIAAIDFLQFCFGRELREDLKKGIINNAHIVTSKLEKWAIADRSQVSLFFIDYCKCAVLSNSTGALKIRELMSLAELDSKSVKDALDKLDGNFMVLDIINDDSSCTIKMIAPDETRPGQSKYVEMSFVKEKTQDIENVNYQVTTLEYGHDDKEVIHAYIANQLLKIKGKKVFNEVDIKPTIKQESTADLIQDICQNAENDNAVMPLRRLETARNNFKQRALLKLLDLYTEQDTSGQFKLYSDLDIGTQLHTRIRSKAEAKVNKWLEKPKAYWSLCYKTTIEGFKAKKAPVVAKPSSRDFVDRFASRSPIEDQPKAQPKIIKKVQQQIKAEMVSVDGYRRDLSIRSLVLDASSNEYLKNINRHSANNYASWLKAMGIKNIVHIVVTESLENKPKVVLEFKNAKAKNLFYKELGYQMGVPKQNLYQIPFLTGQIMCST